MEMNRVIPSKLTQGTLEPSLPDGSPAKTLEWSSNVMSTCPATFSHVVFFLLLVITFIMLSTPQMSWAPPSHWGGQLTADLGTGPGCGVHRSSRQGLTVDPNLCGNLEARGHLLHLFPSLRTGHDRVDGCKANFDAFCATHT